MIRKLCPERPRYINHPTGDGFVDAAGTFVVITSHFGKPRVHVLNKAKSLYLFGQNHPVRKFAMYITTNQYFEVFVLLTIFINCVFLALTNPPEEPEYVFAAIYTGEMILKIIAKGFVLHKYAYLRDPWNWLDFVVVILGYITLAPGEIANLSGIRTFRVFRALRTISAVKGLRMMVNTLLSSIKMLWDVLILTMFFICIFALVGMQLFVGVLRNKCAEPMPSNLKIPYEEYANNSSVWILDSDEHPLVCGNDSWTLHCAANQSCLPDTGSNPNFGYTSFDHFGWAILTSLQLVTLDFWENVYNNILYTIGPWSVLYFLCIVLFGRFYLINLVLAVVAVSYENEVQRAKLENDDRTPQTQRLEGSTFSLRSRSVLDLVYGEQDVLDETVHKNMYDQTKVDIQNNSLTMTQAESETVFQVREGPNGISASSDTSTNNDAGDTKNKPSRQSCSDCDVGFLSRVDCLGPLTKCVRRIVESETFEGFIIFIIVINTIFMSIQYHGMNEDLEKAIDIVNWVCTFIFLLEMILKLIAFGFRGYVKSGWNIFDGLVVAISLIDAVLTLSTEIDNTGISVLRSFRLLRILKLAKSWTTMSNLLTTIGQSLGALVNLSVILGIVIYIFAVVGMQLFGSTYTPDKFDGEVPRWRFTDFWHSFLLIFRIICGEWVELLWDCMRAAGPISIVLFIPAFLIGHLIILNLFLALLLSSFSGQTQLSSTQSNQKNRFFARLKKFVSRFIRRITAKVWPKTNETSPEDDEGGQQASKSNGHVINVTDNSVSTCTRSPGSDTSNAADTRLCCCSLDVRKYEVDECFTFQCNCCTCLKLTTCHVIWLCIRYNVKQLVEHKLFEWFIVFLIAASSIALAFEDVYLDSRPTLKEVLEVLNIFFAVVFSLEFFLKVIGLGFTSYFSCAWNWLDFTILVVSLIALFGNEEVTSIRSLRTLRALRPLRAISRFERMRVVISSLFHAIPGIANVLLVCVLFWLIFSIMGVNLFGGKFYKCVDENGHKYDASVVPNKTVCLERGDRWMTSNVNFDNSFNGFLALLQVATFEGWMEVMEDAIDATKVDQQPVRENNMEAYIFFIVFIITGSFFVLNLFIGVIIENFNQRKQQMEVYGSMDILLTPKQRSWMNALKNAATKKPTRKIERPTNRFQAAVFDLVQSRKFEIFIIIVIAINMLAMMVQHYDQPHEVKQVLDYLNIVFTVIFIVEAILRIIALRWRYFQYPWNVFDFIIVILSIVGIIVEQLNETGIIITPNLLRVVRVFRIGRLLRFFEKAQGIKRLVFALVVSLSALFNIGAILFLIMFIYALIGMSFFANVKKTGALNDVVNFETFLNSILLIFRLMTAAGWNDVLDPLMIEPPDCDPDYKGLSNGNCGNYWAAVIYFYSFIIVIFLVLINMYVAVILENYNNVIEQEKVGITGDDIDLFYHHWMVYDPMSTQYIYFRDLSDFLHTLEGNLGIKKPNKAACALLNIPLCEGDKIYCLHLLQALVRRVVTGYEEFDSEEFNVVLQRMEERFRAAFPAITHYRQTNSTMAKNRELAAARVITRAVVRYRKRKREQASGIASDNAETVIDSKKDKNGHLTVNGTKGSHIADLVVHNNNLSDSLSNLSRNADSSENRTSLKSTQNNENSKTPEAINHGFEEDEKGTSQREKRNSVVPVRLIRNKDLSGSFPRLGKPKLTPLAWSDDTAPKESPQNYRRSERLASMRGQTIPISSSLKKIKIKEQSRIDKEPRR